MLSLRRRALDSIHFPQTPGARSARLAYAPMRRAGAVAPAGPLRCARRARAKRAVRSDFGTGSTLTRRAALSAGVDDHAFGPAVEWALLRPVSRERCGMRRAARRTGPADATASARLSRRVGRGAKSVTEALEPVVARERDGACRGSARSCAAVHIEPDQGRKPSTAAKPCLGRHTKRAARGKARSQASGASARRLREYKKTRPAPEGTTKLRFGAALGINAARLLGARLPRCGAHVTFCRP